MQKGSLDFIWRWGVVRQGGQATAGMRDCCLRSTETTAPGGFTIGALNVGINSGVTHEKKEKDLFIFTSSFAGTRVARWKGDDSF